MLSALIKKVKTSYLKVHNEGVKGPGDVNLGPVTNFNCPSGTNIAANPNDCSQYYTCYPGESVYLWQCFSDYLFDTTYNGCNFPQNVQCGSRPHNQGSPVVGKKVKGPGDINLGPVTNFNCPSGTSISANPNDCSQYYTCYPGEAVYLWQCFSDYLFDTTYNGCNFPQNVQCGSRPH